MSWSERTTQSKKEQERGIFFAENDAGKYPSLFDIRGSCAVWYENPSQMEADDLRGTDQIDRKLKESKR